MSQVKPEVVKSWAVASDSTPGLDYAVLEWTNGRFTCECMSFTRGRQQKGLGMFERSCKHTRQAEEMRDGISAKLVPQDKLSKALFNPGGVQVNLGNKPPKDPFAAMDEFEKEGLR